MKKKDRWGFIETDPKEFCDALAIALQKGIPWRDNHYRFLDVGAGRGSVPLIATGFFQGFGIPGYESFEAEGLEIDPTLVKEATKVVRIFEQDALTFDGYGSYDIIHSYQPIREEKLAVKLERLIEDQMGVGAVLLARLKMDTRIETDPRFKRLDEAKRNYVYTDPATGRQTVVSSYVHYAVYQKVSN